MELSAKQKKKEILKEKKVCTGEKATRRQNIQSVREGEESEGKSAPFWLVEKGLLIITFIHA